jgi:hypothetical protein
MTWWMTLQQVSAHLGPKPKTLQRQIYDERGLGRRLHATKPGRDYLVDARDCNAEAEQRGKAFHFEPDCGTCAAAGLGPDGLPLAAQPAPEQEPTALPAPTRSSSGGK